MRAYLRTYALALGGVLAAVALVNLLVNPYDLFPIPAIKGVNDVKTAIREQQHLAKAYEVARARPQLLLLGSSRALQLHENSAPLAGRGAYNLALASAGAFEQLRYFQHALCVAGPRAAVWGLDLISYVPKRSPLYYDGRLAADGDGRCRLRSPAAFAHDYLPALLSLDALRASLGTLTDQPARGADPLLGDKRERVERAGGHRRMFERLEHGAAELAAHGLEEPAALLGDLRTALRTAYARGVDLKLFFSPEHARLAEVWFANGRAQAMARWKREVVRIVAEEARRAGREPFPVWDFGGYNSVTTEPLPAEDDRKTLMQWWWEGSHYSVETGNLILARLFDTPGVTVPEDFGVKVTEENVDAHLAQIEAAHGHWAAAHTACVQAAAADAHALRSPPR